METSKQNVIILMGPPGCGKGTQALRISSQLHVPHISTGDLFRKNIKEQTSLGEKAKKYMDSGQYVPDHLVLDMLFDRVSKEDCAGGYVLDGFPRTVAQAKALDKRFETERVHPKIVYLNVSEEAVLDRLGGRLTCKECGHIHHVSSHPPQKEGVCDRCGGELVQRVDDTLEVIKERLHVYNKQTEPVIDYYKEGNRIHIANGETAPDHVFEDVFGYIYR